MANMLKKVKNSLKNTSIQRRRAIFLTLVVFSIALISIIFIGILDVSQSNNKIDFETLEKVRDRNLIDDLRNVDITQLSNDKSGKSLLYQSYDSSTKGILIEDEFYNTILKMRLASPYSVTGLIASSDTKVAEFYLEDWEDGKIDLIDTIQFFNVEDNYEEVNKEFWFKYGTEYESCVGGCQNYTTWTPFERLSELPHKNIKISLWTSTEVLEKMEWVPTIEGFKVYQWAAWEVSTASYQGEFKLHGGLNALAMYMSPDGTNLYVGGTTIISQWYLTIPYNVSSATQNRNITSASYNSPAGLYFKPDGTKLFISVTSNTGVFQYSCSEAWNITTCTSDSVEMDTSAYSMFGSYFEFDGSSVYINDDTGNDIHQYFCSASWDLSTCSESQDENSTDDTMGIVLKTDGTKLFATDRTPNKVYQYTLSDAWNISTMGGKEAEYDASSQASNPRGLYISTDGSKLYVQDLGTKIIYQYFLSAPVPNVPKVVIDSPLNQSYNTVINYSITATDDVSMELGECWFSIDGGTTNISLLNSSTHVDVYNFTESSILSEGGYLAEFGCNNTAGVYNNSESISFTIDTTNPNINITFPINETAFTSNIIDVNYTTSDNSALGFCWYSNDTYLKNTTLANCGTNITTIIWSDGLHNVTVWVNDTAGNVNSSSVSFTIDATSPNINITTPSNNSNHTNRRLDVNFTVSDTIGLFNCWYSNDTYLVNISLATCGTNITEVIWSSGKHNVTVWANDTAGNVNSSSISFSIVNIIENSQSFSATALEQSSQTFSINITYDSTAFSNIQAILNYNNTAFAGTRVFGTGDQAVFNRTITTPSIDTKTNFTFYWAFTLTSTVDEKVNSTFKNQTVSSMVVGDCDSESTGLYNFTIVDEKTQVKITGVSGNTSALVHIELYTSDKTTLIASFSQNFTKLNPFSICLNDSLSSGETYSLDAQIQYGATGYATEFYHIQSAVIDSTTLAQNITLYDLDNSTSTSFKITYKDSNFLPLANALIQIQRKYITNGVFRTVEIPKTDSNGQTIAHLEEENAVYTFIVVKNGVIQATFTDFLVKCEDPVLGTCEINLNAFKSHLAPENFIDLDDFLFTLSYNRTTRTVKTVYTIPTGNSATILLNTTLYDGLGNQQVCSSSLTSASGTLTCVVPTSFGNSTIVNTIYKDGTEVARGILGIQESPASLYGANLMFLGLFLIITMVGVGLGSSPMISGVFLIFGAVLSLAFNLVANTGFFGYGATILWLIIAVIIVLMKGARRE